MSATAMPSGSRDRRWLPALPYAAVLVGMACISTMVLFLDALFNKIERRLVPWVFKG